MIKRLWYSLLSNDKPQDKNVIWIDTSNSESFTLKLYRNGSWKPLQVVGTSRDMIERELTGYVTSHYHSYDRIINKPTTLEGYGITDCFNKSEIERLLDDKVTKVDGMSLTSNNFSDKYKKMLDNLSTSYYNKKNVDNLLNEKQNVISDLESIREGAKKGSTALQSFTETDPIYLKDKPFIALKSDLLNDNNFVHKEGDENIKGTKWFEHIRTNNFSIYQEDNNNHSVYIDYYYDESNYLPILHFSSEEDWLTILDNIADPIYDFHAANKHYVDEGLATKANLQHQHMVADITDFPELYYDATAFFTSETYPSDKYEELLEAVKAKRTVYATIDEAGYTSYVFFMSSANGDGSSSRVLLTTIFADGSYLYLNTFVLQQSGMTPLQESITGKANKATTLAGYGIGDAYTKSEVDTALNTKQNTLTDTDGGYGQRVAELEKEGIASQEKLTELESEVTDLVTSINNEEYIQKFDGWFDTINTISKYGDSKYIILPVFRAISMHIKTRSDQGTNIFIAKDYHDVVPATIELASGETGRRYIEKNEDVHITLPSDAKYVYLQHTTYDGISMIPDYLSIDGVVFISVLKQDKARVIDNTIIPGSDNYILSGGVSKSISEYIGQFLELGDVKNLPILYDDNGTWMINSKDFQGKYFAFSAGKKLKITPNGKDALFSFLESLDTSTVNYVSGTSRNTIYSESIITAPEGTNYVWIMTKYGKDRTPRVEILGYLSDEIHSNNTYINNLMDVTSGYDSFTEHPGWLDGNLPKIVSYGASKFIVIPIKDRKKIHITIRESINSLMFIAKNYGTNLPVTLELATGETGRREYYGPYIDTIVDIPSDAEYLYVQSVDYLGNNVLPSYLSIDGIQIIPQKEDNNSYLGEDKQILRSALKSPVAISESSNIFTFIHTSDTHLRNGNSRCFENIISLLGEDYINCLIHTGDIVWDNFPNNNDMSTEGYNIFTSLLQGTTKDVVFTVGNHDVGGEYKDINICGTDKQIYDTFYAPFMRPNFVVGGTDKSYFYVDYPQKVRFISLYQYNSDFELDPTDNTKLKNIRGRVAYRQDEIDWLCSTLNSTPSDYAVFILTHEPDSLGNKTDSWQSRRLANKQYYNLISSIVTAYKNRTTVNVSITQTDGVVGTITANYDFSSANGNFAAFLNGHTHDDFVGKDYSNNLNVLNKCCDNMMYQSGSSIFHIINSYSENTINVVTVNTTTRKITVFRIGAKYSADGDFRNVITLDY